MPTGRYTVMDGKGNPMGTEEFRCAPGPAGWRYFSTIETKVPQPHRETVDLVVDGEWRFVRVRVDTGDHDLVLGAGAQRWIGTRDGEPLELDPADDVDYLSPAFNAATANRLGESGGFGGVARPDQSGADITRRADPLRNWEIEVLYVEPFTLEPVRMGQRYELEGLEEVETPVGRFSAVRWTYTALPSGWSRPLWVAGDVVVAYEDVFELVAYDPGPRGPFPAG
ncbi:MAG: hypothetical protein ACRDH8_14720 [Actinomycetota bacterium]